MSQQVAARSTADQRARALFFTVGIARDYLRLSDIHREMMEKFRNDHPALFVPDYLIGGAVAGYLEGEDRNRGLRVGGYARAIAAIPLVLLVGAFIVLGTFGVAVAPGEAIRTLLGILLLAALAVAVIGAYTIGLSAVGGYVGVILADRWDERRAARPNGSIDETSLPSEPESTR